MQLKFYFSHSQRCVHTQENDETQCTCNIQANS